MFLASFSFEMANKDIQGFYYTRTWKQCRSGYIKSKGGLCEKCLSKGLIVPGEIVHHKIHLTADNINDPNITLNWDNLELVCRKCHAEEHEEVYIKNGGHVRRYRVNESGEIILKQPPLGA